MPQLCTRMQNKAAMPERKTMLSAGKKSLAPQPHKFTKTEHCSGASGNPCTAPCTLATHICLHGSREPLLPVLGLAAERAGSYKMKQKNKHDSLWAFNGQASLQKPSHHDSHSHRPAASSRALEGKVAEAIISSNGCLDHIPGFLELQKVVQVQVGVFQLLYSGQSAQIFKGS